VELVRVEIERYGLLENYTLDSLAPGLNLIAGDNEAGKTTLLSFIRTVLFGFPSKRQANINDYRLNPEDKLGGRLVIKSRNFPQGLTIERRSGKGGGPLSLYLADGTGVGEDALGGLLGNLDRTLYRNIFAFGLNELASLETLSSEQLQARFYSAGSGTGIVEALKRLDKEMANLFKPTGSKPLINAELAHIRILDTELSRLGTLTDRYAGLVRQRSELERELESLERQDSRNAEQLEQKRKLFSGRDIWNEYRLARARLNELETLPEDFPERAEDRLSELNESIRRAEEELGQRETKLGEEKAGFVRKEELEKIFSLREKITPVARGLDQFEKAMEDLPKVTAELESNLELLKKKMAEINRQWTVEDLLGFDNSIATRDRYRAMKKALEDSRLRVIEAGQSLRHAEEEFRRADQAFIQAERSFQAGYSGRISLVKNLSLLLPLGSLGAGAWLLFAGQGIAGGIIVALALGLFLGWLRLVRMLNQGKLEPDKPVRLPGVLVQEHRALDDAMAEKAEREKLLVEVKKKQAEVFSELKGKQGEFSVFLGELGLEESLSPDALGDVISQVSLALEEYEKAEQLRKRIGEIDSFITEYSGKVCALLKELGQPEPGRRETGGAVNKLLQDLERAREYYTGKEKHEQNLKWLEEQVDHQKALLDKLRADKERLIAVSAREGDQAAETFEDRFLRHARVAAEREQWLEREKEARSKLTVAAGSVEALENYLAELERASFDSLAEEIEALEQECSSAEQEKKSINQRLGEKKKELEEVSTEARAGQLRLERSVAVEQLETLLERWAVLALAAQAVRRAMERYERERQPEVLRHGQKYFEKMTSGRYERISSPLGERRFEVFTAQGRKMPPEKLSRGTAEQLYLALRLGLIEERKKHGDPVPIMMDDILVNFDPRRAAAACRAIAQIAESHQVIYLTCHPHIVELLEQQLPEINMLRLEVP